VITNQIYHCNCFWHVGPVVGQKMENSMVSHIKIFNSFTVVRSYQTFSSFNVIRSERRRDGQSAQAQRRARPHVHGTRHLRHHVSAPRLAPRVSTCPSRTTHGAPGSTEHSCAYGHGTSYSTILYIYIYSRPCARRLCCVYCYQVSASSTA